MDNLNILFAKLTLKNGTKIRTTKEVILETATHFKGDEIIKKEILVNLGEPNEQLTREQWEKNSNSK